MKRFGTIHYSVNSRSFRFLLIIKLIMLVFYYNKTLNSTIIFDFRIVGKLKALVFTKAFKLWKGSENN